MSDSDETYCICNSNDDSRFMICCDNCNWWFHGDCIGVKAETAKKIKEYYCEKCRTENDLGIVYKQKPADLDMEPPKKRSKKECGVCIGCFRTEDCGRCDICKDNKGDVANLHSKPTCRLRQCVNINDASAEKGTSKKKPPDSKLSTGGAKLKNVSKKRPPAASTAPSMHVKVRISGSSKTFSSKVAFPVGTTRASARAYKDFMVEAGMISDDEPQEARQCFGPGCVMPARAGSKYCSDETCGLKLARALAEILPGRLQQWKLTPSVAEEFEKKRLDVIEQQMEVARQKLATHVAEEENLTNWINESRKIKADLDRPDNDDDDVELTIFCATCGSETSAKTALRHIVRCFSKYESQTSYGSSHRTINNIYNIFCDAYNKTSRTYCKRLRVICPEHCKEAKIDDDEICASPLSSGTPLDKFEPSLACLAAKKFCLKHYKWDRIRRAMIDMERLVQLLKLDELFEEQRALNAAVESRGGVLALMLHQTIKHDQVHKV